MMSHYYDPYRSVPEINKGLYYNYPAQIQQQQQQQQQILHQQSLTHQQSSNKWVQQNWTGQPLERDSSHER